MSRDELRRFAPFFVVLLAQNVPTTLPSMLVWFPELAYALILVVTLGIGWSIVYTAMAVRTRRLASP